MKKIVLEKVINDHYHENDFNVSNLAKSLGVCESYLREYVHSKFLVSPQKLIETKRLIESIRLLKATHSIHDLAAKVGYKNTRSFRRAFKRVYGISHQQYKSKLRKLRRVG